MALLAAEPARDGCSTAMGFRPAPGPVVRACLSGSPLGTAVGAGPGSLDDDNTQVAVYF
jgi:hypothetical protein